MWRQILVMSAVWAACAQANVLLMPSANAYSHQLNFVRAAEELSKRGVPVKIVLPEGDVQTLRKSNAITGSATYGIISYEQDPHDNLLNLPEVLKRRTVQGKAKRFGLSGGLAIVKRGLQSCPKLWASPAFQAIQDFQPKVLFGTKMNFCLPLTASKLQLPYISLHPGAPLFPWHSSWHKWAGQYTLIPNNPSYIPQLGTGLAHPMTFRQRIRNWSAYLNDVFCDVWYTRRLMIEAQKTLGFSLADPQEYHRLALSLYTADFALEPARLLPPDVKLVGPVVVGPAKPLPQDLEEWVSGSGEDGVIYVSTGTVTLLGPTPREQLAAALRSLPPSARVLWRLTPTEVPDENITALALPSHVKVVRWVPQNDLLGHPKLRVFVSQCGANSIYEAAYHGVPILATPGQIPDQVDNAMKAAARGFCIPVIIGRNYSTATVAASLERLLHEREFTNAARAVQRRLRARARTSLQEMADWVEFVLNTTAPDGTYAPVYKLATADMPLWKALSLDILAAAIAAVLTAILAASLILRTLGQLLRSRNRAAAKKTI